MRINAVELRIEEVALGVEHINIAGVAGVEAHRREAARAGERRDPIALRLCAAGRPGSRNDGVPHFAECNERRLLVLREYLPLARCCDIEGGAGASSGEDRRDDRGSE